MPCSNYKKLLKDTFKYDYTDITNENENYICPDLKYLNSSNFVQSFYNSTVEIHSETHLILKKCVGSDC